MHRQRQAVPQRSPRSRFETISVANALEAGTRVTHGHSRRVWTPCASAQRRRTTRRRSSRPSGTRRCCTTSARSASATTSAAQARPAQRRGVLAHRRHGAGRDDPLRTSEHRREVAEVVRPATTRSAGIGAPATRTACAAESPLGGASVGLSTGAMITTHYRHEGMSMVSRHRGARREPRDSSTATGHGVFVDIIRAPPSAHCPAIDKAIADVAQRRHVASAQVAGFRREGLRPLGSGFDVSGAG